MKYKIIIIIQLFLCFPHLLEATPYRDQFKIIKSKKIHHEIILKPEFALPMFKMADLTSFGTGFVVGYSYTFATFRLGFEFADFYFFGKENSFLGSTARN